MRHRTKRHHLSRPADQRRALLRSLITQLFLHGRITTTLHRAKAVRPWAEKLITVARRGDLAALRHVARDIYPVYTGFTYDVAGKDGKTVEVDETVLRRVMRVVAENAKDRPGGYIRITQAPPRRGDAAPMAVIELVDESFDHAH